jgi:hypothetical protein
MVPVSRRGKAHNTRIAVTFHVDDSSCSSLGGIIEDGRACIQLVPGWRRANTVLVVLQHFGIWSLTIDQWMQLPRISLDY